MVTSVYVQNGCEYVDVARMFDSREGYLVVDDVKEASLICFIGGSSDVDPWLYSEENKSSEVDNIDDFNSVGLFYYAANLGIPCVGICRGAQFLNVMNEGGMIQNIEGHSSGTHQVLIASKAMTYYSEYDYLFTNTIHHQSMVVGNGGEVIAFADNCPEVIAYNNDVPCLCVQFHPEWSLGDEEKDERLENFFFALVVNELLEVGE